MKKKGSLLGILNQSLQLGGAVFEKFFNLTIDGVQDLLVSVIDYGADLSKVDRSKIIDFLQVINTKRTLACAVYPIAEIEKKIAEEPDKYQFKIDYVEQLERQSVLVMKLMEWMAFSPIERKAVERMFKNVQEVRDEVGLSQLHYDEIKFILASITKKLDIALNKRDEDEFKYILVDYLRCQIILGESDNINEYLEILESFDKSNFNMLKGRYLFSKGDAENAYTYLRIAHDNKVEYSEDLLAQCLDQLTKESKDKEKWIKIKRELFGGLFSDSNKEILKSLPFTFLQIKWQEIHKVYNNLKGKKNAS
ncbi:hypothetical protein A9Q84_14530 [Halobacteriovorax marinus]|uniref:Uncharacterized protein n=1 Tax=Halobacteriovorax marinus TaxID=97084 RepID=A0A1Y5FAQ3_9BACT|nr:hypothetical protein A9Q84_14530 [Halobacteriovorax marinus]